MSWQLLVIWVLAYLLGAIPFGWLLVWITRRKDIRYHASGRMGMSNVIRMVGIPGGVVTAVFDIGKGTLAVWMVRWFVPDHQPWMLSVAGLLAILGHIYSVFIIERRRDQRIYFRGGAGGLTSIGAAIGLWFPILPYILIPAAFLYFFIGYASLATISFNVASTLGFAYNAAVGREGVSWWFAVYGLCALALVTISLRPNIKRLRRGDERLISFRIRWRKADRTQSNKK